MVGPQQLEFVIRGARVLENLVRGAVLNISPWFHHAGRASAMRRTIPRSWVMNNRPMPSLSFSSCQTEYKNLRLNGYIPAPWSVHPRSARRACWPFAHTHHHTLPLPTRQGMVRDAPRPAFGVNDPDLVPTILNPRTPRCRPPANRPDCSASDSDSCFSIVCQRVQRCHRLLGR